jgi:Methyltransferase domain
MNVMSGRDGFRTRILHLTPGRARIFLDPATSFGLEDPQDLPEMETVQAIVLEALPGSRDVARPIQRRLAGMTGHVPFFAVHSGERNCPLAAWAGAQGTLFDRLVVPPSLPAPGFPLPLVLASEQSPIEAVYKDLQTEIAVSFEHEADYTPAAHWEARARQFGPSGRAVCYANAPRILNKMMHKVQIEALVPAIARAAAQMKRGSFPPSLMEFGCGIGRLARYCTPYVRYHGADISRGMIDTAREINPGRRFFTTPTLETATLPEIDIVMTVTVLHHNDRAERLKILASAARLAGRQVRLVLLEDMMSPAQIKSRNMYPLSIESLLDEIAATFGGTCTQAGFELVYYKPNDLIPRTGLIELDVLR